MSQYTSYHYETEEPTVSADTVAETSGVSDLLNTDRNTWVGRSLKSMREKVKARIKKLEAQGTSPAMARLEALKASPLLEAAVLKEFSTTPDALVSGRDTLLDRLNKCESTRLDQLIHQGDNRLLLGQTKVLTTAMKSVLSDQGYQIHTSRRPLQDVVVIKGVRAADNTAVSIRLTPKDEKLETDLSGFQGGACTRLLVEFEDTLRRRGVKLKMVEREAHGCAGGFLTQNINAVLADKPVEDSATDKKRLKKKKLPTLHRKVRH